MPTQIRVRQGETKAIWSDDDNSLVTDGVSTCICIMVLGRVESKQFLAMMHWDGFDHTFDKNASHARELAGLKVHSLFADLAGEISSQLIPLRHDKRVKVTLSLDQLALIGGERAQDRLSGTELEVEALKQAKHYCESYFKVSDDALFIEDYYSTSGDHSLKIVFSAAEISCFMDEYCNTEDEEESQYTDDSEYDSDDEQSISFTP